MWYFSHELEANVYLNTTASIFFFSWSEHTNYDAVLIEEEQILYA